MANTHIITTDNQNMTGAYSAHRVFKSVLTESTAGIALTSGTAYFVYVGRTTQSMTPKYVEFYVSVGGAGAQTAEVGLFSTPAAPNKANQTVSKIEATGTVDDLTSTGVKRNTAAFSTAVASGTYLWAGIRTALASNPPTLNTIYYDFQGGHVLSAVSSGALTGAGPWTGAIRAYTVGAAPDMPQLRITLD